MSGLQSKLHCDSHALWLENDPDRSPIEHNIDLLESSKFKFQDTTAFGTCKLGHSEMVLMLIRFTIIPLIGIYVNQNNIISLCLENMACLSFFNYHKRVPQ